MNFADQGSWHILHIDDDEDDFILTREMLGQSHGRKIQVDWSPSFEEGKEKLAEDHYDAVLVDYDLGVHTGIDLIREYSPSYPAPLILYTGRGSIEVDIEAMQAGATMYLTKREANPLLLERAIRYAIELNERRRAAEQARYQASLLAQVQDAIIGADKTWHISYWNRSAEEVFGWTAAEAIGKTVPELLQSRFPGSSREEAVKRLLKSGHFEGEVIYRRKDGVDITAQARTAVLLDQNGELTGFVSSMHDITESKRAEEEIKQLLASVEQERARLQSVINNIPDEVWFVDTTGNLVMVNEQVIKEFGPGILGGQEAGSVAASSEVYRPDGTLRPPDEAPPLRALNGEYVYDQEEIVRIPATGELRFRQVNAVPVKDDHERLLGSVSIVRDITEWKRVEAALEAERDKLEAVLKNLASGVIIADPQGKLLSMNSAAMRMHDFQSSEDLFTTPEQFYNGFEMFTADGQAVPMAERPVGRAIRGEFFSNLEFRVRTRRTGRDWIGAWNAAPVYGSQGEIQLLVFTVRDITLQKQSEEALQASEARLQARTHELEAIINTVPAYMFITHDPQAREMTGNKATIELMRVSTQYNLSKTGPEAGNLRHFKAMRDGKEIPDEDLPVQIVARTGVPLNDYEFDMVFEDGETRHLLGNISPLLDEDGKPAGAVSAFIDITKRKEIEAKLRESENRFRVALTSAPITVFTTDRDLRITWMYDPRPEFQLDQVMGLRLDQLAPGDYGKQLVDLQLAVLERGEPRQGEINTLAYNQPASFAYYIGPIVDEAGKITGLACAGYDVTDRKLAESELQRYAEELKRSNQALQDFAFIASHDLREPLRKVQAFGHMLDTRFSGELGPEGTDYIRRIRSASTRMAEMLDGLLTYSRLSTRDATFEDVDLQKTVEEVLIDLEILIRETGGKIEVDRLPSIQADSLQMRQLMQNLIGNALKYHRPDVPPVVKVFSGRAEQDRVEIIVEDNGIGFNMKDADRLFQPFVRLHGTSAFTGTGMGLAICKKIAERHGGTISVQSRLGEGSSFTITLPTQH